MSALIPGEDPTRIETLLRAAEKKALTDHRRRLPPPIEIADDQLPSEAQLAVAAARELERRALRLRYLPADLIADYGWLVLLDLFVCEHDLRSVKFIDAARRWQISPATAARLVAALIESHLVVRVFDKDNSYPVTLRLTDLGRMYLKRILALSA
ncbi:MAG: hypothetical protein C0471_18220 [Erythrobacter sp.]|nr:hypothetical protein [Erythrobacter sp.]